MSAVASPRPVRSNGSSGYRASSGAPRPRANQDRPQSASGYRGQFSKRAPAGSRSSGPSGNRDPDRKPDPTLFQHYFKSIGPRTYAVQIKRAQNQNPYLVITEGKRDDKTGEVRKTRVFVYGEDFDSFIDLLRHAAVWIKQHPVSDEFKQKRQQFWQKRQRGDSGRASPARGEPAAPTGASVTNRQQRPATTKPVQASAKSQSAASRPAANPVSRAAGASGAATAGSPADTLRLRTNAPPTSGASVARSTMNAPTSPRSPASTRSVSSTTRAPAASVARGSAARFAASRPARTDAEAGLSH